MKKKFISHILCFLFTIGYYTNTQAHILFINANENTSEFAKLKELIKKQNANKNCDTDVCEKLFMIPKEIPASQNLTNAVLFEEFNVILKSLEKDKGIIDQIILSGHSDGSAYTGEKKTRTENNYLTVETISNLFKLNSIPSDFIGKYSDSGSFIESHNIENLRHKFKPKSLLLMGCHSMESQQYTDLFFSNAPKLQVIIGTTNVWPLGSSLSAAQRLEATLGYSQALLRQKNLDLGELFEKFSAEFPKLTYQNHDLRLALRSSSNNAEYFVFTSKAKNSKIDFDSYQLAGYGSTFDITTDLYLKNRGR